MHFVNYFLRTSSNHFKPLVCHSLSRAIMNCLHASQVRDLTEIFLHAVNSVKPRQLIRKSVKVRDKELYVGEKCFELGENARLVGFGKAVLGMACEVEAVLGRHLVEGVISLPMNARETLNSDCELKSNSVIRVYEGAENNLPDPNAEEAADAILKVVQHLQEEDLLIVLISGGGSALLPKPAPNITLQDKVLTTKLLASVGADITEVNTVRKRLSLVKGGGLAQMSYPCRTLCLILSDIIHDPVDMIASGPTVPNKDSASASLQVIKKYKLELKIPRHVLSVLTTPSAVCEIPVEEGNFVHVDNVIIGNNTIACTSALEHAASLAYLPVLLSTAISGVVQDIASFYTKLILQLCESLSTGNAPQLHSLFRGCSLCLDPSLLPKLSSIPAGTPKICLIAGGEPTVQIQGQGKGGRNQELALWFSEFMHNLQTTHRDLFEDFEVVFLSAGTDGIDGPTDVAGAFGSSAIYQASLQSGIHPDVSLANNDSYNFYKALHNGVFFMRTGHTGTNVMDLHFITITMKRINTS